MSNSYMESSFDYRSLLPPRFTGEGLDVEADVSTGNEPSDAETSCFPDMSWRERLLGCATCVLAGYMLSFGSFWRIRDLVRGDPLPFVLNVTIGNLIALAGSCFLTGPKNQVRSMWQEKRRIATGLYVGSLLLTLLIAFTKVSGPKGLLLLFLVLSQYVSITWYTLSYIPFAQEMVSNFIRRHLARS